MSEQNSEHTLAAELRKLLKEFQPGGKFSPIEDRTEFDKLTESLPPEERELTRELTNHADLLRYFAERKMKTGPDIADAMFAAAELPVPERIERIRAINQTLMERLGRAGEADGFRN
jgi:guanyl-specific ribonuclease Sa